MAKLAVRIADELERRLAAGYWRDGEVIGSETELLDEFKVSRPILREAILTLEQRQVAVSRRGPGGGLLARIPDSSGVAAAVARCLQFQGVTAHQLFQARSLLEQALCEHLCSRISEASLKKLRAHVSTSAPRQPDGSLPAVRNFHLLLADAVENPVFAVYMSAMDQVAYDFVRALNVRVSDEVVERLLVRQRQIVEAIALGDAALARAGVRSYTDEVCNLVAVDLPGRLSRNAWSAAPELRRKPVRKRKVAKAGEERRRRT
jgi:DNA-binding FadR family transcriptional regulator